MSDQMKTPTTLKVKNGNEEYTVTYYKNTKTPGLIIEDYEKDIIVIEETALNDVLDAIYIVTGKKPWKKC